MDTEFDIQFTNISNTTLDMLVIYHKSALNRSITVNVTDPEVMSNIYGVGVRIINDKTASLEDVIFYTSSEHSTFTVVANVLFHFIKYRWYCFWRLYFGC